MSGITSRYGPSTTSKASSLRVAVIGAGAAGLVAARELLREGHDVAVFEQSHDVGGVWDFDPNVEDDILGVREDRTNVHSSMYASLRTNLPRELMAFLDFQFDVQFPDPYLGSAGADGKAVQSNRMSGSCASDATFQRQRSGSVIGQIDPRRFPGHAEVQRYLKAFAAHFGIVDEIRFRSKVLDVRVDGGPASVAKRREGMYLNGSGERDQLLADHAVDVDEKHVTLDQHLWPKWTLRVQQLGEATGQRIDGGEDVSVGKARDGGRARSSRHYGNDDELVSRVREEEFDAVVVCNGHYSQPRVASIEGSSSWPGVQMHSHSYRAPDMFAEKVVVIIGAAASGEDISLEVADVAKAVHISSRGASECSSGYGRRGNISRHGEIKRANPDGSVDFKSGERVFADTILHCTGYSYAFPFLSSLLPLLSVDDNRVGPLYHHVFSPHFSPTLAFIGLPWKVIPFPLCELQSRWVAKVLSGTIALPEPRRMMDWIHAFNASLDDRSIPKRYSHRLDLEQFSYMNWLSGECGGNALDDWRQRMYIDVRDHKKKHPLTYRDELEYGRLENPLGLSL